MKSTKEQIRQVPKIAGTIVREANIVMTDVQEIPDKALSVKQISRIMNDAAYSNQKLRSAPFEPDNEIEVDNWNELVANEEKKITEAEEKYRQVLQEMQESL